MKGKFVFAACAASAVLTIIPGSAATITVDENGNSHVSSIKGMVAGDLTEWLADRAAPPAALYTNVATATEIGPEGNNLAFYTSSPNRPGLHLLSDGTTVSYVLISNGIIPDPTSALLIVTGIGFLCIARCLRARSKKAHK